MKKWKSGCDFKIWHLRKIPRFWTPDWLIDAIWPDSHLINLIQVIQVASGNSPLCWCTFKNHHAWGIHAHGRVIHAHPGRYWEFTAMGGNITIMEGIWQSCSRKRLLSGQLMVGLLQGGGPTQAQFLGIATWFPTLSDRLHIRFCRKYICNWVLCTLNTICLTCIYNIHPSL